jgi:hypothetical protein
MDLANTIAAWGSCAAAIVAVIVALYVSYKAELPEVVTYLKYDSDHVCMYLVVKNCGNGVARNVKLSGFDYDMADAEMAKLLRKSFVERGIPVLVPGAERSSTIQAGNSMCEHEDDSCVVTVSYDEKSFLRRSKTVSEDFTLDFYSFSGSMYVMSDVHGIKQEFVKASKTLERIDRSLNNIGNRIADLDSSTDDDS